MDVERVMRSPIALTRAREESGGEAMSVRQVSVIDEPMLLHYTDPDAIDEILGHRERVGGKAVGLARLASRALPVPEGFVIPVSVFRDFLTSRGLLERAERACRSADPCALDALTKAVLASPLPEPLARRLGREASRLGPSLAVRSSGIQEDHRRASFAGLYHTALGVRPDRLGAALLVCWSSAFNQEAISYARRAGLDSVPGMAVLVQRMIPARASGVVFTTNPLTGSYKEMIVEAVFGLGEALVSGKVVPDHYLVRRPRRLPSAVQRVAARVRLDVLDESVAEQERRLVLRDGVTVWEEVPEEERSLRKISRENLLRLCRLALRVEAVSGCPQDVEWVLSQDGKLVLLQARPVTASPGPIRGDGVLWTRRFIGERWNGPATPLGWSLIEPLLRHFIAYPETHARYLGNGEALRLLNGAPYINATVFRHLAFKLPGAPPPRFMMEMLPPEEERSWNDRFAAPPDFRVYASILGETWKERRWRRFRWNPLTNHLAWDAFEVRLERELPSLLEPLRGDVRLSGPEALTLAERGMELVRAYIKIHVTSLLFANLLYQIVGNLVRVWAGPEGENLARDLLCCPGRNLTVLVNQDIWRLARLARESEADLTHAPDPDSDFGLAFADLLARHGHRSDASWEIMSDRWVERPERVLDLLRRVLEGGAEEDPGLRANAQAAIAEAAVRRLATQVTPPLRRAFLLRAVDLTRKYLLLRENQRYHFDRLLYAIKRVYLAVGRGMVEAGLCEREGDVRLLRADEVAAWVEGSLPEARIRELLRVRAATLDRQSRLRPPDFLKGDEVLPTSEDASRRLSGLGASPGQARGQVRILRSLEEAGRLRKGEILVAPSIDPGWTPLLLSARGLILELGGQLSHGAVVAREYHLPAVVNVRNACLLFQDGMEVTIDGTRGKVWIHE
jgi:pyruvate,water dikinase